MSIVLTIMYFLLVVSLIVVVISDNRNPIKAIAWVLVITLVPIAGIVFYLLFGQDQRRKRIISRRVYKRLMRKPTYLGIKGRTGLEFESEQMTPLMHLFAKNSDSVVLPAEDVEIYDNGEDKFDALFKDIEEARHHIHIQYYIIEDDEYGVRLQQQLIRKARSGVRVRVIYDHVGSWGTKHSFWRELREGGVEVYPYMKVTIPLLASRANYRNHRKVVVVDAQIGYIGGMNIAKRYAQGNNLGIWRDTHIRITGVAVAGLQSSFLIDWYIVSRRVINLNGYYPSPTAPVTPGIPMQTVSAGPVGLWRVIEQGFIYMISRASRSVAIETPYLLPTDPLKNALVTAALSGVKVEVILPKKGDARMAQIAGNSYIQELLEAGVRVYFYTEGFIHSKLIMVDGLVSSVGSSNMDFRSFEHNFEINTMIYDEGVTKRLEALFQKDLLSSKRIELEHWRKRNRLVRFVDSFARLFSPLL